MNQRKKWFETLGQFRILHPQTFPDYLIENHQIAPFGQVAETKKSGALIQERVPRNRELLKGKRKAEFW